MSRRRGKRGYDSLEIVRIKAGMAERVVSEKDQDFGYYTGASLEISSTMAIIDFMLRNDLLRGSLKLLAKLYRDFLNQQRKAFFSSTSSEISKLGFMLGVRDDTIRY